jgi:hypothetical protein
MIAVSSIIDNNEGSTPNFGTQYLFKGDYQGTQGSDTYGIWTDGGKNYFSGNVGIGISSPGVKLHVESASLGGSINDTTTQAIFEADTASSDKLYIQNYRTVAGTAWTSNGKRIQEKIDSTWMGYIQFNGGETVSSGNGDISFGTGQSTTQSSVAERMRIDSSGNVGIGTDSPASNLEISDSTQATGATLSITNAHSGSWASGDKIGSIDFRIDDASATEFVRARIHTEGLTTGTFPSNSQLVFSTTNSNTLSEAMRIDSSGNVGIGTTSPSSKFQVEGAPANGTYLSYLYNSATHNSAHGLNVQTTTNNILTYGLRVNTGGDSNALAVMGNGTVGIGTASPYALRS